MEGYLVVLTNHVLPSALETQYVFQQHCVCVCLRVHVCVDEDMGHNSYLVLHTLL